MEEINGMLTGQEMKVADVCLGKALDLGADKVRITLNKSLMELFGTLNGELDKVNHCLDRSISVCLSWTESSEVSLPTGWWKASWMISSKRLSQR